MKNLLIALAIAATPVVAYASCTYSSYTIDGRTYNCSTCCFNGICNTECN
jgi:hypothetical protein